MTGEFRPSAPRPQAIAHLVIVGLAIILIFSEPASLRASEVLDRKASRRAVEAGRAVRDGLHRGIAGDLEGRSQAIEKALKLDADCELARWHRGELRISGEWLPAKDAATKLALEVQLSQYEQLRDRALQQPGGDLAAANWCATNQVPDLERLHLYRVLQQATDPSTARAASVRLKLSPFEGVLLPPEAIEALHREAKIDEQRLKQWMPTAQKWADGLIHGRRRQQSYVREQINDKLDVTAVPALEQVFADHSESLALELISLLGTIKEHEATTALVRQSLYSNWDTVRTAAAKQLKARPRHDFVPTFLQQLSCPIQTQFAVNVGADGLVRHQHLFYREQADENYLLEANFVGGPMYVPRSINIAGTRDSGATGKAARQHLASAMRQNMLSQIHAQIVRQVLVAQEAVKSVRIEQEVALANQQMEASNQVVFWALEESTGELSLSRTPQSWWEWWQNYTESYQGEKPTYQQQYGLASPYFIPYTHVTLTSCFPAGTKVRTIRGMQPIEDVRIGDRVLAQNVETGELAFKIVLKTTQRPPSEMLEIGLGESIVTTTKGHPFWVNGVGWRMAKQLQGEDQIHALDGAATVSHVKPIGAAVAYNLVVADFNNYFVGELQVLVHDNTYRKPTQAILPGLLRDDRRPGP